MRVLVTGGAGFIGSHLTDGFLARGDEVTVREPGSKGPVVLSVRMPSPRSDATIFLKVFARFGSLIVSPGLYCVPSGLSQVFWLSGHCLKNSSWRAIVSAVLGRIGKPFQYTPTLLTTLSSNSAGTSRRNGSSKVCAILPVSVVMRMNTLTTARATPSLLTKVRPLLGIWIVIGTSTVSDVTRT